MSDVKLLGYVPGAIGRITELHATYYHEHWGFGRYFESKVATELSELGVPSDNRRSGGSDDIGDISLSLPTVTLRFPSHIPGHRNLPCMALACSMSTWGA